MAVLELPPAQEDTLMREMLVLVPPVTLCLAAMPTTRPHPPPVLTQVLPQQPGQHRVSVWDEICFFLLFVLGNGEQREGLSSCLLSSKGR